MQRIKCSICQEEFNVALGTFGYGMPKECPRCGGSQDDFVKIADNWEEPQYGSEVNKHD